MKIKETPINEIKPYPHNPRKISKTAVKAVAKSIQRFGWQQPIVVDTNNIIIVGHTRHQAAQHLELETVPVLVATNLTEYEARAYRIADNRAADYSEWDYPELVNQLESLYTDFGDTLMLENWEQLIEDFNTLDTETASGALNIPDNIKALLESKGATITATFYSQEDALAAKLQILEMPGVLNVADKR